MYSVLLTSFLFLASPPVYDSEAAYNKTNSASKETRRRSRTSRATKNRKSQVRRQSKTKRLVKRRRGNIQRSSRSRHIRGYGTQRRTRHQTRRQNSRATNNTSNRTTNRVRKNQYTHQHPTPNKKSKPSKGKRSARSPVHLSPLQREILRLQMGVLLRDPEMGHIYRQILSKEKKSK